MPDSSRSMPVAALSDALIQRLPQGKAPLLRDRIVCGLCLRVGKRVRTFMVATTCRGEQVRTHLGRCPLITVEEARQRALDVLRACRNGTFVSQAAPPSEISLKAVLPDYCAARKLKPQSRNRYDSILRTHFETWYPAPIESLNSLAFQQHCQQFVQTRSASIVVVGRGAIAAMIKYVNATHGLEIINPFAKLAAAGLVPGTPAPRQRKLQKQDLPRWHAAVQTLGEVQRDYLYLLLYTGLRRNEASTMTCSQVRWEDGVIFIPDTKNGRPHTLPITARMQTILERRCAGLDPDDLIFPGLAADHVAKMAARVGAPRFMLHDLRKLAASVGEEIGLSAAMLRRILNHTAKKSDTLYRHYVQIEPQALLDALERLQDALLTALEAEPSRDQSARSKPSEAPPSSSQKG